MMKHFIFICVLIALSSPSFSEQIPREEYVKAVVLEAGKVAPEADLFRREKVQSITLRIAGGSHKGRVITVEHAAAGGMMGKDMILKKGDRVMLYVDENPTPAESPTGEPLFHVADHARDHVVYWLAALYMLLLVALGGMKGVKSLISLVLTVSIVFFVLFPLTLRGFSPLLVSVAIAAAVSFIVFRIIAGNTPKGYSAAAGTALGVAVAGLVAFVAGKMAYLTGLSSEESRMLLFSMNVRIDYEGLLFGSILIGALGAVMDVGMSIASSIEEVRKVHPEASFKNLFVSGMNVGKDVMGTMSNTLILAYTGSALPLLLLLTANNMSMAKIMNLEMIAEEVVRALAGSIGLVLCIPITAFVSALINSRS